MNSTHESSNPQQQSFRLAAIVVGGFLALTLIGGVAYWSTQRSSGLPKGGVTLSATVKFIGVEGGCWMLKTKYGLFLAPNLPKEFRVDGLKVTAKAQLAVSQAHYCPMGRGIVVVSSVSGSGA